MAGVIVTDLTDLSGYLTATVTYAGKSFSVDRKFGSWQALVEVDGYTVRRDVLFFVAEELQAKARRWERTQAAFR